MRRLLWPLNPVYAASVAAKNVAYDRGWLKTKRTQWPVVSVGNLSAGGSGKTPFVIALARLLVRNGVQADVLSRGYGRSADAIEKVNPSGDAARSGDEPLLIAQSAGVPVYVGADRYEAGLVAEKNESGPRIHLLDDGFQHRRLARDLDIVLLHRTDFSESLLPVGNLREPLSALRRASAVVLRQEDAAFEENLRERGIEAPVWLIRRVMNVPFDAGRVVAFCGIARPGEFFSLLRANGAEVADTLAFRDHHRYTEDDLKRLIGLAKSAKADAFLTTEKDSVRLPQEMKERLSAVAPLRLVPLETRFEDMSAVLKKVLPLAG
ncbi:MAG TPA: tetraacyldisaccharide 4'-kinase [Pseudacidobacterium sp.]|nr:tetraacyldisaccharide 4'-kinase [Pseudacidobacterium sp.]